MSYPCAACGGFYSEDCGHRKNARDCGLPIPCVPDRELMQQSRPSISAARVREIANKYVCPDFRQPKTILEINMAKTLEEFGLYLLREAGVEVRDES